MSLEGLTSTVASTSASFRGVFTRFILKGMVNVMFVLFPRKRWNFPSEKLVLVKGLCSFHSEEAMEIPLLENLSLIPWFCRFCKTMLPICLCKTMLPINFN